MKRLISIILALGTIFTMVSHTATVQAEEPVPRFTYTSAVSALIEIDTTLGIAYCQGRCQAKDAVPVKVMVFLEVYSESNATWQTLKSWVSKETGFASVDGYHAIARGYSYRVRTVGYVYNTDNEIVEIVSAIDTGYL